MGNCFRKKKIQSHELIINNLDSMYVLCNNNGFIIDINDKFTKKIIL